MQNNNGSKVPARKAADQGTIAGSMLDEENWRLAAELVEQLRDAGYECELRVLVDLH